MADNLPLPDLPLDRPLPLPPRYDAIIVAGGTGRRLGTLDKPGVLIGGRQLLDFVLDAVSSAQLRILVARSDQASVERAATRFAVRRCVEDPVGGGPLAAVSTGLTLTTAPIVILLAGDLPFIAPAVPLLLRRVTVDRPAVLTDATGRPNPLAAAWPRTALIRALHAIGDVANQPMRRLAEQVDIVEVPDDGAWGQDCDNWADVHAARIRVQDRPKDRPEKAGPNTPKRTGS